MENPNNDGRERPGSQDLEIEGSFRITVRTPAAQERTARAACPASTDDDVLHQRDLAPPSAVVKFGDPDIRSPFPPRVSEEYSPATDTLVVPYHTILRRGGAVTFQVAPYQQVAVYEPGTDLAEIRIEQETLEPVAFGPFTISNYRVNDPTGRLLLSPSPSQASLEWTTPSGTFDRPGRYLVISVCVPFLSFARMHGWVEVK